MREMKIDFKAEIANEFEKFVSQTLFNELSLQNISWITNGKIFTLFLPDRIDENLIREQIIQTFGSKAQIR